MRNQSMQHIKIQPSLIEQFLAANQRIAGQITLMNDNPTAYTGETLKHALRVIAWHCDEQKSIIDTFRGHVRRINALIDDAEAVLQGKDKAFTAESEAKLTGVNFDNWLGEYPKTEQGA